MCGILGVIGPETKRDLPLARALDVLAHRGPDDRGEWSDARCWLGHRRLSIIDLSPAGHQPMLDPANGTVITFNGEIYNYLELRDELRSLGHHFSSKSDTEVLLAAYRQWGAACLSRLNGMWSFVIWDPSNQKAFFARDRFGVKPLYWACIDGTLALASEPKALLVLLPSLRRVDEATLFEFLADGKLYSGGGTFYKGISSVPAAHSGTFSPGDASPKWAAYWALPANDQRCEYDEALSRFSALFEDATRLRMRSDVPVGITLSGGLDSSAILHAAVGSVPRIRAFTSVYASEGTEGVLDERHWARLVAARHAGVQLEEIQAQRRDWLDTLPRIVWHMDGPGYSPAVFPLWGIMSRARAAGVPVLLEGQGADELIGGYPQYAAVAMQQRFGALLLRPAQLLKDWLGYSSTFGWRPLLLWMLRESIPGLRWLYRQRVGALGALRPEFVERHRHSFTAHPRRREVRQWLADDLTRDILPGLLQYGDAISMAHSIESRLPFLDYRLVELVAQMPAEFRLGNGESKRVLRDYLRQGGLPEIGNRRDKRGYPTPAYEWMASEQCQVLRDTVLARNSPLMEYVDEVRVRTLVDNFAGGRSGSGNHLYRLLTTDLWLRALRDVPQETVPSRVAGAGS